MKKSILLMILIIGISFQFLFSNIGYTQSIAVLPVQVSNSIINPNANQTGITQLMINQFLISGIDTIPYDVIKNKLQVYKKINNNTILSDPVIRNKKYLLVTELEKFGQKYILNYKLIHISNGKIIYEGNTSHFSPEIDNITPFFNWKKFNKLNKLELTDPEVFKLTNNVCSQIISIIEQKKYIKTQKKNRQRLEIMFVISSITSAKDEIQSLIDNIDNLVQNIRSRNLQLDVYVSVVDHKNLYSQEYNKFLPFTNDMSKVIKYLEQLTFTRSNQIIDYRESIHSGLNKNIWSSSQKNVKLLFFLTDKPINYQQVTSPTNRSIILPLQIHSSVRKKDFTQNNNLYDLIYNGGFHYQLIDKINMVSSNSIISRDQQKKVNLQDITNIRYFLKQHINSKSIDYAIYNQIKRINNNYYFICQIYDTKNYNLLFNWIEAISNDNPARYINSIGDEIYQFYNSKKINENNIVYNKRIPNIQQLINLAKLKNIHVYTIGFSGINSISKRKLKIASKQLGGDYIPLRYHYTGVLKGNKLAHFVYFNETLYQSTIIDPTFYNPYLYFKNLNDLSLGSPINTVESSMKFLVSQGLLIKKNTLIKNQIHNNLRYTLENVIKNYVDIKTFKYILWFQSGNYRLPIPLDNQQYQKIKSLKGQFYMAINILPTNPYNVKFRENNRLIHKRIYFKLFQNDIKFIPENQKNYLANFLMKSINILNQNPNYYSQKGLSSKHFWYIKGTIEKIHELE